MRNHFIVIVVVFCRRIIKQVLSTVTYIIYSNTRVVKCLMSSRSYVRRDWIDQRVNTEWNDHFKKTGRPMTAAGDVTSIVQYYFYCTYSIIIIHSLRFDFRLTGDLRFITHVLVAANANAWVRYLSSYYYIISVCRVGMWQISIWCHAVLNVFDILSNFSVNILKYTSCAISLAESSP